MITPLFYLIVAIGIFSSCSTEDIGNANNGGTVNADGYLQLTFNLPEFQTPVTPDTRAMTPVLESSINKNKLHVLVFKADASDNTFMYKAPVLVDSYKEDTETRKATVTIKLMKDIASDLVVMANYDLPNILEGITKEELYKKCIYSMPKEGKWNTDIHIPMSGTTEKSVTIKENSTTKIEIALRRAMARIDVGLNFKKEGDNSDILTETATGLDNFKLGEIKVVHTYDQGLVGSSNPKAAYIPEGAERRKTDTPLTFEVPPDGTNSFVREIYVPQAGTANVGPSEVHCVIIGGYYRGSKNMTYYRMDFAQKHLPGSETPEYLDILGNYRYVFNITGVTGPGFLSYKDALNSTPSIDYELIVWDESIHEMHIQGKYYFGLDNREITLKAKSTADDSKNKKVIKYQTNYPISDANGITLEWENPKDPATPSLSPHFTAQWTKKGEKGEITITANNNNETNTVLTDVLHIKLGTFTIKVSVHQEYINFKYTLNCSAVKVFGTYRPGLALDPKKHYIKLDITAEEAGINGTKYIIETDTVNGIWFRTTGTFNASTNNLTLKNIILKGGGALDTAVKIEPFTVTIRSNSSSGSYCEATIHPVNATMTIVSLSTTKSDFGYNIGFSNSLSGDVIRHPANFGPNDNSRVKIEGFNFIAERKDDIEAESDEHKWLTGIGNDGKIADILFYAYNVNLKANQVKIIKEYMEKGGVVVALDERSKGLELLMQALFGSQVTSGTNGTGGSIYPLLGNEVYRGSRNDEQWQEYKDTFLQDPILNGPFGDIREKQWGNDANSAAHLSPASLFENTPGVTIYSYAYDISNSRPQENRNAITCFRYESEKYNIFWVGDGGFNSQSGSTLSWGSTTICPFIFEKNTNSSSYLFPLPKSNFGHNSKHIFDVYNSQMLCNIMAWAIERSTELLPKREAAMGR